MKTILIVFGLVIMVTGCTKPHDISHEIDTPPGNKHDKPTVTIDGVEYVRK